MNPKVPNNFALWPEQASTIAGAVDALYIFEILVSTFFVITIPAVIIYFCVKYRRRPGNMNPPRIETSKALEVIWSVIPLMIVMVMFFWGAQVFFRQQGVPENALEILVTGKKWMWKFQHKNGHREINDLHVPVGQPVVLKMASEDVIHDVYIPAFRTKQDVLPGRYTYLWFEATKTGVYHLFCNQYCGTQHSNMVGKVIVMEEADYQKWLGGYTGATPEQVGEELFTKYACNTCHLDSGSARGPLLAGIMGTKVAFQDGSQAVVDENYLRESILQSQAKIVAGFQPIMPSFQGLLTAEEVNALIAYIKSMPGSKAGTSQAHPPAGAPDAAASATDAAHQATNEQTESNDAATTNTAQTTATTTSDAAATTGAQQGVQ